MSDAEISERAIGPPKAVVAKNTRLPESHTSGPDPAVMAAVTAAAAAAVASHVASGGGAFGGMSRLATPSFTPGREGFSPLMTWGELGSTPLRLDGVDEFDIKLPPGVGTGPFQV